jgi:DeoR/GlpR family transcriptional regulator of sugar metabolism
MSVRRRARRPELRQEQIARAVLTRGSASAQDLAAEFNVSLNTVHRDLDELERQGVVRKFHGGASAEPSGMFESNVAYRLKRMVAEKRVVARHATRHIEPGMSVMIDDSTTTLQMVPFLADAGPLRLVTNYLEVMRQASGLKSVSLMALGGDYDPLHSSFLGVSCVEAVQSLRVDVCFASTSAVHGGYAYHQEQHIVSVKRAMLDSAARTILLIDHTKLARVALHRVVPLSRFDLVLVDDGASADALRDLDEHKVRYEVCPTGGGDDRTGTT